MPEQQAKAKKLNMVQQSIIDGQSQGHKARVRSFIITFDRAIFSFRSLKGAGLGRLHAAS
jgi:hypothetical protein